MKTQSLVWRIALPWLRVALVAIAALGTSAVLLILGQPSGIAAVSTFGAIYLLPINILSLVLVRWLLRREGSSIRELIGFDRSRLGRDIGWGTVWLMVLWIPFTVAIMGTMFALYGDGIFGAFETVFAPDAASIPALGFAGSLVFAVVAVLTFAPLNAPAEELVFRGHPGGPRGAEGRRPGLVVAVLLPSIAFGVQHMVFAATVPAMLVYAVAFFAWGLGSALIYRWQRRLMPLIIAHVIVNLFTSLPSLILPFVLH